MAEELQPRQKQDRRPGTEAKMRPEPDYRPRHPGAGKLEGRVALITGGDSGIGRAVALAMAREGASISFIYLDEHEDAEKTEELVREEGADVVRIAGDIGSEDFCALAVEETVKAFGRLDILVNNAGEQHVQKDLTDLDAEQIEQTFRTNIFACFYMVKAALPHLGEGASIINTTSVTAYKGSPALLDYSATKGAIVSFTRSLSVSLMEKGIRVNAVAPGPIWTPLIPASYDEEKTAKHGLNAPMKRAGQPNEVAPAYVFLASDDGSYMSGQVLHPNGGTIVDS